MRKLLTSIACLVVVISSAQSPKWDLQQCLDYAISHNTSMQRSEVQAEILANNLRQSKMNRLPTVSGSASHNYNIGYSIDPFTNTFTPQSIQSNTFSINFGVTLFSANRITNGIKSMELQHESGTLAVEIAKNQTSWSVVFAFLNIVVAERNLEIMEAQEVLSKEQLELAEKRVAAGADNKSAVFGLKSQLASDQLQVVQAQNQVQNAYLNMINLLQLDNETEFEIELPNIANLPEMPTESLVEIYESALGLMPELKQADVNMRSAYLDYKIRRSALYPTLSAYGNMNTIYSESGGEYVSDGFELVTIGYLPSSQEEVVSLLPINNYKSKSYSDQLKDNIGQSLGLSVSIPVFNNYRTATDAQNAKLNMKIGELNALEVKNQLRADITTAYTNLLAGKSSYDAAVLNLEAQELNYEFAKQRFDAGLLNSTDLLM
ncbi:MAG: TolC family protein, partial [Bacteroidia bacterium]